MLTLAWTLLLLGCPKPTVPLGQRVVEDITFEGNGWGPFARDGASVLQDSIDSQASRHLIELPGSWDLGPYVGDLALLDEVVLAEDADRLVIWYQHHGWFDARFLGWETRERRRKGPGGAPAIDLKGRIDRGEPSVLDADPEVIVDGKLSGPIRRSLDKLLGLRKGDVFDLDAYTEALAGLQGRLQERGYAYAVVGGHVAVRADQHRVHIRYDIAPGRPCVYGEVSFVGETGKLADRAREELDFEVGDGFRTSDLLAARQRLYGLGVYSLVEVTPVLRSPDQRTVPIQVRLARRPSRQFGVGPSLEVETNRQELAVAAEYQDDDVFSRLHRWHVDTSVGVATTVELGRSDELGRQLRDTISPVASLGQMYSIPKFFSRRLELSLKSDVRFDVLPAYREFEAQAAPALTWRPDRRIALTGGYRLKYHQYFDFESLEDIEKTNLSSTVSEKAFLSALEQSLIWDARDDKLAPTRNYYLSLRLAEAGGPLGGDLDFFRVEAEGRSYRSIRFGHADPHTVVAGRLGGGLIVAYGDVGIDVDETLKLGGGSSVRGWAEDRLGPRLCYDAEGRLNLDASGRQVCTGDGVTVESVGGAVASYGSLEVRQELPWSLGVVGFVDVGRVWDRVEEVSVAGLQWSVGGGLRYRSPIGPIRLDAAWVPSPDPTFANEPGWSLHLGIGEAF
ncbi:MAG: hypothetical protein EXR71_15705 [Myxococcales bacterium]|nr:hypothetical protein [Myxococcales bacterium]